MPAAGWMRSMRGMPLVSKFILKGSYFIKSQIHPANTPLL
jgi:hypothetical protein